MAPETTKLQKLNHLEEPRDVLAEVKRIALLIFPQLDFNPVQNIFTDILNLFNGKYPGYQKCDTLYHDLKHTIDCLLVMARIIDGAFINGIVFKERGVFLGLISATMHDTGYIKSVGDDTGTGAKYTSIHIDRSIEFMKKYLLNNGYSLEDVRFCRNCLKCTGLSVKINEIQFKSRENEIMGKILGTADLLGQMGDRKYLENLFFLYFELKEAGVPGYNNHDDLLKKTPKFWELMKKRFASALGNVDRYLRDHFRVRWGIDRDLDREAVERNIEYLKFILENHESDYQKYLRRDWLKY